MRSFSIGHANIGSGHPCFIIAELSANHSGKLEIALETVRAAKRAGADAIKLQTYRADTITLNSDKPDFVVNQGTVWDGKRFYELYEEAHTPWEWHEALMAEAAKEGLICFSSPFDFTAVDFLEKLDAPAYKIASFEITDIPLIQYIAQKGKPVIISTGVAQKEDIDLAIATCKAAGNHDLALLRCTSSYPAPIEEARLSMIPELAATYDVVPGLSDHTKGTIVPALSVAVGGKIIEKHIILDKAMGGPDAGFSLDIAEFTAMVKSVREAEMALGQIDWNLSDKGLKSREFSRSLYISADVKAGDKVTAENVKSVRPNFGLHPRYYDQVLGKKFNSDFEKGTRLDLSLIH